MKQATVDNRGELMDRALELFAAYGYDGVGVQNICEAASVTKPTLYHYFRSKRGLLEALMHSRVDELIAALRDAAGEADDLRETLARAASASMAFARRNPSFYRLYLALWFAPARSEGHLAASKYHALHFEALQAILEPTTQGEFGPKSRGRALTASFLGALNNAIGLSLNNYGALNERVAYALVDQFLYGVLASDGRESRK